MHNNIKICSLTVKKIRYFLYGHFEVFQLKSHNENSKKKMRHISKSSHGGSKEKSETLKNLKKLKLKIKT